MGRPALAALLLLATSGIASAGPTRKVMVETEPPGATVYLNDTAEGAACESTPCAVDAPIGDQTIIIRLEKHQPVIEPLSVAKGKKPIVAKFKLDPALGKLIIDSPKGANVTINDEDKGKVPVELDLAAEAYHVVVAKDGKTLYDDFVNVEVGAEQTIDVTATKAVATGGDGDGGGERDGGGDGDGGDGSGGSVSTGAPAAPRKNFINAALAFDVGFRNFTWTMPVTPTLRPESEGGQVLLGPAVELWPMRLAGMSRLRGLSLYARAQFGVRGQQLEGMNLMGTVTTFWRSYEASLRHRWYFGPIGVEVSGGYVNDVMRFSATDGDDIEQVPDASYKSIRLGGKLAYKAGKLEPYVAGENRIVLSGGTIETRFDSASASGLRGALGAAYSTGPIVARVEGALMHYSWTFQYDGNNDTAQAEGATDHVTLISFLVGYNY